MQKKIRIIGMYAPSEDEEANTKDQFFTNLKFNGIIADIRNTRVFLFGDFNDRKVNRPIWRGTNER